MDYILLRFISKSRIFQETQSHSFPGSTLVEQNPCLVLITQIKPPQLAWFGPGWIALGHIPISKAGWPGSQVLSCPSVE